jgi:hypothetical protein
MTRWRTVALALPLAGLVALGMVYIGIGPDHIEICSHQSGFERAFYGDRLGAVDGANYSGCVTPSGGAYAVATMGGVATLGLVLLWTGWGEAGRRRPGTTKAPIF